MKFSEIKNLSWEALKKKEKELNEEAFELKMKHALGKVGNPLRVRFLRKDKARLKTVLNSRLRSLKTSSKIKQEQTETQESSSSSQESKASVKGSS